MDTDKRIEAMEGELKLMKGELKQTLSGVRDFLLEIKLPPPPQENYMDEDSPPGLQAPPLMFSGDVPRAPAPEATGPPPGTIPQTAAYPFAEAEPWLPIATPELPEEQWEQELPEEPRMEAPPKRNKGEEVEEQASEPGPQVNLLANLIRWVSVARKEIGDEQLPVFMELYRSSGYLSPEMEQLILHLSEVMTQESVEINSADTWGYLILQLHGILAQGGTPLQPLTPSPSNHNEVEQSKAKAEEQSQEDQPIRLKLVLPIGGGVEKEFSLALAPENGKQDSFNALMSHIGTD